MINVVRAEMVKLTRRRVLVGAAAAVAAFAAVATLTVFLSAEPARLPGGGPGSGRAVSIEDLGGAGGATQAFATGASFAGFFVFVTFIANIAGEFSLGTIRTMLMRQPRRLRLLAGKAVALLAFAAGVLVVAETVTVVLSTAIAASQGVATGEWFTLSGLGHAIGHYGTALSAVTAWALLGLALGSIVRSIPVALGIGIAWAGPFEHLIQDAWEPATRWFPGLLIEALAVGGTPDVSHLRAAALVAAYAVVAAGVAATLFARRDITS